ncbi:ORF145 [Ranid herpesvirus 2]|uniref:ORF145 n=1 Tax=Ranid herpesvirus 2 TaxID=389214 RepID=Q14VW1_9VIRU|nr:ORF145 [Ranid herpesvirus 2]ABG25602.1 ORF145 [Ranid herpesvirus 2]
MDALEEFMEEPQVATLSDDEMAVLHELLRNCAEAQEEQQQPQQQQLQNYSRTEPQNDYTLPVIIGSPVYAQALKEHVLTNTLAKHPYPITHGTYWTHMIVNGEHSFTHVPSLKVPPYSPLWRHEFTVMGCPDFEWAYALSEAILCFADKTINKDVELLIHEMDAACLSSPLCAHKMESMLTDLLCTPPESKADILKVKLKDLALWFYILELDICMRYNNKTTFHDRVQNETMFAFTYTHELAQELINKVCNVHYTAVPTLLRKPCWMLYVKCHTQGYLLYLLKTLSFFRTLYCVHIIKMHCLRYPHNVTAVALFIYVTGLVKKYYGHPGALQRIHPKLIAVQMQRLPNIFRIQHCENLLAQPFLKKFNEHTIKVAVERLMSLGPYCMLPSTSILESVTYNFDTAEAQNFASFYQTVPLDAAMVSLDFICRMMAVTTVTTQVCTQHEVMLALLLKRVIREYTNLPPKTNAAQRSPLPDISGST